MAPEHRQDAEAREAHASQRAEEYPLPDDRLEKLRGPIAERLRRSGIDLPADEFEALVLDMARFALRWSNTEVGAREKAEKDSTET
jgi:hypothetical protein